MSAVKLEPKVEPNQLKYEQSDESEVEDCGFIVLDYTGQPLDEAQQATYNDQLDPLPDFVKETSLLTDPQQKSQFRCLRCNKEFQTSHRLRCHTRLHDRTRQFNCDFCSQSFLEKAHLKVHRRIHTYEKPYECSYCHWSFAHKPHLTEHVRIHSGERPFVCADCGKTFKRQAHRHSHVRNMHKPAAQA